MALTNSRSSALDDGLGAQRPRICAVPPYVSSTGGEAIALAAMAGLYLDDWQQFILRESLGERPDGKWAAQTVGLVIGRQNGKGSILEARELAGLFLLDEQVILHTAHQQKTATNHFRRLRALIKRVPEFEARVVSAPTGKGSEAIYLDTGQVIYFATRSGGGGRGLTVDLIVYDEAMYLSEQDRSALAPTMAARSIEGNIQTWYAGSAVDQMDSAHDGVPFAQVRQRGIEGAKGVAFFEWSLPYDSPDDVPAAVAADVESHKATNPSYGKRISAEYVEHEQTVELGARGFAVERLGVGDWPSLDADAGRVISREAWAAIACLDESQTITSERTFAIDVAPNETFASIASAGLRDDGVWHFAIVEHRRGTGWIVDRVRELLDEHGGRVVADSRGQSSAVVADLREAALISDDDVTTSAQYAEACAAFFNAVLERRAWYPAPQPELDEAVASARTTPLENAWKWSRLKSTSPDISPLVAATLALWGARAGASEFATVLYASDELAPEPELVGARAPVVLGPEDYTTCFRCATGSHCELHGG